jgi:hypothetical protein
MKELVGLPIDIMDAIGCINFPLTTVGKQKSGLGDLDAAQSPGMPAMPAGTLPLLQNI